MKKMKVGDTVQGEVIYVSSEYLFVDIKQKSDGILPITGLSPENVSKKFQIGDPITAYVNRFTPDSIELTQVLNKKDGSSQEIRNAFEQQIPVKGKVIESVKGGFRVSIMKKTAFCPISKIDTQYCDDPQIFVNKDSYFIITDYDPSSYSFIVSRKEYLIKENYSKWQSIQESLEADPDKTFQGKIIRFTDRGTIVEIEEGLSGFLPDHELSLANNQDIKETLSVGQELEVMVHKVNLNRDNPGAIFSIRRLNQNKWQDIIENYTIGKIVQGVIIRNIKGGYLVEIEKNLSGFLPQNEVNKNSKLSATDLSEGNLIDAQVKDIDTIRKNIILSLINEDSEQDWKQYTHKQESGFKSIGNAINKEKQ